MESLPELVHKKQLKKACWQQQDIFPGLIASKSALGEWLKTGCAEKIFPQHAVIKESSETKKIPPHLMLQYGMSKLIH